MKEISPQWNLANNKFPLSRIYQEVSSYQNNFSHKENFPKEEEKKLIF